MSIASEQAKKRLQERREHLAEIEADTLAILAALRKATEAVRVAEQAEIQTREYI